MGKVEVKFEADAEMVERLEAAGIDLAEVALAGLRSADWAETTRRRRADPAGAERRAQDWAERNKDAIAEFNRRVEERGLLSDYEPFKPRWMR